jgi:hypothetical protein
MEKLSQGTEVEARGLRWELVYSQPLGNQTLYRLRGLEGATLGEEFDFLYPFEPINPISKALQPNQARPLPNWLVYHQAFLLEQALGAKSLAAVQPGRLHGEPHQLVPVIRAIRMSRVRLMLADGVGLGKTIQAGLVLTELIAQRILLVTPAGPLQEQWASEICPSGLDSGLRSLTVQSWMKIVEGPNWAPTRLTMCSWAWSPSIFSSRSTCWRN